MSSALSAQLATDLGAPLRIGIGIHTGPAVVGRMGWGESFYLTAVGDTVHVAARLEQATKDYDAQLVVSVDVARHAALDLSRFPAHDLTVRNRAGQIAVGVIDRTSPQSDAARPRPDAAPPEINPRVRQNLRIGVGGGAEPDRVVRSTPDSRSTEALGGQEDRMRS